MISRRSLEAFTALMTGTFGVAVAISATENGIGWSRAGIEAGTFPFIMGLCIVAGSLYNLTRGVLSGAGPAMLGMFELKRLAGLYLPACIFVAAIPLLGLHLAAAFYVFGVVVSRRVMPVGKALVLSVGTAVALYLVFNRAFQVDLPSGLLESAFGL